jgi:hemerythrin-like domain-containing protein
MEPLDMLRNEHGLIRQYVDHLADAADKIKNEQRPPREFFEKATQFSKEFADQYHHVKEEYMMFVRLAMKKGGEMDGEIESLRHQHEMGKNYISTIRGCLDAYAEGDPARTTDIVESLGSYVAMERQHIHTEDHVFFPLVAEEFTDTDMDQVRVEFDKARQKAGADVFERNHKLVTEMGSMLQHM